MAQADLNGLDTTTRSAQYILKDLCCSTEPLPVVLQKVQKGELGVKAGKGWYDYSGKTERIFLEARDRKLVRQLLLFNEIEKENRT